MTLTALLAWCFLHTLCCQWQRSAHDLFLHAGPEALSASGKVGKPKQHVAVQSRVKQQLQQAQALHEQRDKARQQRLQAAAGPRYTPIIRCLDKDSLLLKLSAFLCLPAQIAIAEHAVAHTLVAKFGTLSTTSWPKALSCGGATASASGSVQAPHARIDSVAQLAVAISAPREPPTPAKG